MNAAVVKCDENDDGHGYAAGADISNLKVLRVSEYGESIVVVSKYQWCERQSRTAFHGAFSLFSQASPQTMCAIQ